MRNPLSSFALAAAAVAAAGSLAFAHPPGHRAAPKAQPAPATPKQETPGPAGRNLQVLPRDIPQERLMLIMRHWGQALGVQCSYCHVPGNFRSDENPHKNIARGMVRMTVNINNEQLPKSVGVSAEPRVNCYTCHRGAAIPDTQLPERTAPAAPQGQPTRPREPLPAHIAPDTPAKPL